MSGPHTYTAQGNLWPPTVPDLLRWIKASWDSICPDMIRKSFKKCGITNAPDGTEDIFHAVDKSDDDEPFEGFPREEIENEQEYHDNVVRGAEIVVSDESVDSSVEEEDDDDDYYRSSSPGH